LQCRGHARVSSPPGVSPSSVSVSGPSAGDQPFWGEACRRSGVGPAPVDVDGLTVARLTDGLRVMAQPQARTPGGDLVGLLAVAGGTGLQTNMILRVMAQPQARPPGGDLVGLLAVAGGTGSQTNMIMPVMAQPQARPSVWGTWWACWLSPGGLGHK